MYGLNALDLIIVMMTAEHPVKLSGPTQLSAKYPSLRHEKVQRVFAMSLCNYKARGSHLYVACCRGRSRD